MALFQLPLSSSPMLFAIDVGGPVNGASIIPLFPTRPFSSPFF